jgi:hypothetical protein
MIMAEVVLLAFVLILAAIVLVAIVKGEFLEDVEVTERRSTPFQEARFRFTSRDLIVTVILLAVFTTIGAALVKLQPGSNWFWYQFFIGCALGVAAIYGNNFRRGVRGTVGGLRFRRYFHPIEAWLVIIGFSQAIGALLAPILLAAVGHF